MNKHLNLVSVKSGKFYLYRGIGDFHCKEGSITYEKLQQNNTSIIWTNLGGKFLKFPTSLSDKRRKLRKGPQGISEKDLGYVFARSGLNCESIVVEAGSGSGFSTSFFSCCVRKVYSYELREEHLKVAKENVKIMSNRDNVEFVLGDVKEHIKNIPLESCDLLFLDMLDSYKVLNEDTSCLKLGAFVVFYIPSVTQIISLVQKIERRDDLYLQEISEVSVRSWKFEGKVARPNHHRKEDFTAFLVFVRKV